MGRKVHTRTEHALKARGTKIYFIFKVRQLMIWRSIAKLHSANLVLCLNLVGTKAVYCFIFFNFLYCSGFCHTLKWNRKMNNKCNVIGLIQLGGLQAMLVIIGNAIASGLCDLKWWLGWRSKPGMCVPWAREAD